MPKRKKMKKKSFIGSATNIGNKENQSLLGLTPVADPIEHFSLLIFLFFVVKLGHFIIN